MDLRAMMRRDLGEVVGEIGTSCVLSYKGKSARIRAVISDASISNGGYTFNEGEAVNASAQLDEDTLTFAIGIGATLESEGIRYRVSNITRTAGTSDLTLALTVEARR